MPTETGFPDDEQVGKPHGNVLAEDSGLSVPASPNTADVASLGVAAYRSLVVTTDVTSNPVTFQIDWTMALDGSGIIHTTSHSAPTGEFQQRIGCEGRFIPAIRFSGSGGAATMDFTIVGSNIDPLPFKPWPMHQWVDLNALYDFGDLGPGGHAHLVDALCFSNNKLQLTGLGNWLTFKFLLGPQYALQEVFMTENRGPDFGNAHIYLAQLPVDVDPASGYRNPRELIADTAGTVQTIPWVYTGTTLGMYNGALVRNIVEGMLFRIQGPYGTPFTSVYTDADGFQSIDGGPGVYAMQLRIDSHTAPSTAYKAEFSQIGVTRVDDSGFA